MNAEIVDLFERPGTKERSAAALRALNMKAIEIADKMLDASFRDLKNMLPDDRKKVVMSAAACLLEGGARAIYREMDGQLPPRIVRHAQKPRR